jgi:hypothetical protein
VMVKFVSWHSGYHHLGNIQLEEHEHSEMLGLVAVATLDGLGGRG